MLLVIYIAGTSCLPQKIKLTPVTEGQMKEMAEKLSIGLYLQFEDIAAFTVTRKYRGGGAKVWSRD